MAPSLADQEEAGLRLGLSGQLLTSLVLAAVMSYSRTGFRVLGVRFLWLNGYILPIRSLLETLNPKRNMLTVASHQKASTPEAFNQNTPQTLKPKP